MIPIVNPFSKTHGAPDDEERHVGDLGNFKTDSNGNAEGTITDKKVKLIGPTSVLGVCEQQNPFPLHLDPILPVLSSPSPPPPALFFSRERKEVAK